MHETYSGPSKKNFCRPFTTKPLITEIIKRRLSVAKKVPYNSQMTLHENCRPFMLQTDDLCFGPPTATYSNGHSSENGQRGIFFIFVKPSQIDWDPHANFWVKIPNIQRSRISPTFRYVQKSQKSTLNGLRNGQSVTYSKIQTKVCRGPWGAPMD